jgi:hypothetical protein
MVRDIVAWPSISCMILGLTFVENNSIVRVAQATEGEDF